MDLTAGRRARPVVVVGAGPVGTSAAILLAQHGVPVVLLDRWADVYPQPRAVHLDDEVHRVLARMGVAEDFAAVSRPAAGLRLVDRDLRVLGSFEREGVSETSGYPRANMYDQPDLERILRRRMAALPLVTFRGGVEVTGVDIVGPLVARVRLRDVASGADETLDASFVLGCDGANSTVRGAIGARMDDLGFEQRWLVLDVDTNVDLQQWEGVQQVCDSRRAATYMRIGETRYRWELRLLEHETLDDYTTIESLLPLLAPWTKDVPVEELKLVRITSYTFRAALADRWRSGPVFLLGDAAHLTPPFIGQGLGAGVRDAANLSWKIAGVLDGELDAEVLETYEPERSAHARAMILLARRLGVVMTRGGRVGDGLRRLAVPALAFLPVVRDQVNDSATPSLGGSTWAGRSRSDRLSGQLCPNAVIGGGRLDDVVGTGWALVSRKAPAPTDRRALADRSCRVVEVVPGDQLDRWLAGGGATAALVRPDRTVLAAGPDVPTLVATLAARLAPTSEVVS